MSTAGLIVSPGVPWPVPRLQGWLCQGLWAWRLCLESQLGHPGSWAEPGWAGARV